MAATPHFTELKELDELECDSEWKTRLVGRRPVASAMLIKGRGLNPNPPLQTLLRFQRLDYAREILSTQHSFEMQHPQLATRRTPSCPDSAEHEASRVWSEATLNLLTGLSTTTDVVASFERSLRLTQVGEAPCAECQEQLEAWVQILGRLWKHEPGVL